MQGSFSDMPSTSFGEVPVVTSETPVSAEDGHSSTNVGITVSSDKHSFLKPALKNSNILNNWSTSRRVRWWDMNYGAAADCLETSLCCKHYALILSTVSVPVLLGLSIALLVFYFWEPLLATAVLSGFFFLFTCVAFSWFWREYVSYRIRRNSVMQRKRPRSIRRRRSRLFDIEMSLDTTPSEEKIPFYKSISEIKNYLSSSRTTSEGAMATFSTRSKKGQYPLTSAIYKKYYAHQIRKPHAQDQQFPIRTF